MRTYYDIYLDSRKKLRDAGFESYQQEAKLLLAGASNKTIEKLLAGIQLYTTDEIADRNNSYVERRLKGEPIAYITNSWEFYGIPYYVNRDVLIPRIDTEVLIDSAKEILIGKKQDARILDLCCGSGNIGCTLAKEIPASSIIAIDKSKEALSVCRQNISRLHLSSRVIALEGDALSDPTMGIGKFDMLISNPPYIKTSEIKKLDSSVKDYEPVLALDGGKTGYDFYRNIIKKWTVVLNDNASIIFEVGEKQADKVSELLIEAGFTTVYTRKDTINVERAVIGIRNNN